MIRSFRDADTRSVAERRRVKKLPEDIQRRAQSKLMVLNNATTLEDLRIPPGNRLKALSGDRIGQHSIRINDKWRVCFVWDDGHADSSEQLELGVRANGAVPGSKEDISTYERLQRDEEEARQTAYDQEIF